MGLIGSGNLDLIGACIKIANTKPVMFEFVLVMYKYMKKEEMFNENQRFSRLR